MNFKDGGQAAITRLLQAYGFRSRQALCEQLGVSSSTMGTRWMRDIFPADWVIQCAIETGVSLEWLSFGKGEMYTHNAHTTSQTATEPANDHAMSDVVTVPRKKIIDGILYNSNFYLMDKALLPSHLQSPIVITEGTQYIVAEQKFSDVTDGTWLVEIEGQASIRDLARIPIGKVRVSNPSATFECSLEDIKVLAKCCYVLLTPL
ncbi:Bacteriophage CI repressor helix-turn-helix domain protein [Serratia marcescens]|uniref:phage repressor protein CI n=1 Tax=Serratia marcescens TaxID=615 RepID=UPI0006CB1A7C|nr:phage repressor protein CI [Serratia marcescens]ALE95368.1 Bacteriophage CI repressor helix-turn-helix domain protein [Serratia marcescens]